MIDKKIGFDAQNNYSKKKVIHSFIAASSNQMLNGQIESIDEQGIIIRTFMLKIYFSNSTI